MKADEVDFDLECLLAECGVWANVDRGGPGAAFDRAAACINADAGKQGIDSIDVGSGKTDFVRRGLRRDGSCRECGRVA